MAKKKHRKPRRGREAPIADLAMAQKVLNEMIALRLAHWMDTSMVILRDKFGFTQDQLLQYTQTFRERVNETPTETSE